MADEPQGIDAFIRQAEADERLDKAETLKKLTPIEYARLRGKVPQIIYYHIRNHHLETEICQCGRKVIDVATADEYFGEKGPAPYDEPVEEDEEPTDEEILEDDQG